MFLIKILYLTLPFLLFVLLLLIQFTVKAPIPHKQDTTLSREPGATVKAGKSVICFLLGRLSESKGATLKLIGSRYLRRLLRVKLRLIE